MIRSVSGFSRNLGSPPQRKSGLSSVSICVHLWLSYFHLRDGNDELAAAIAVGFLLRENFAGKIPRQQQCKIGALFQQRFRRQNRNVLARHQPALLVGAAIHDEIERLLAESEKVDQRAAFGRSAVSR